VPSLSDMSESVLSLLARHTKLPGVQLKSGPILI
jgi:hypothetical protein